MLGFTIDETMTGWHEHVNEPGLRLPFEFRVTWGTESVRDLLALKRGVRMGLYGTVDAAELATGKRCMGTLQLRYLVDASIKYVFMFEGDDGNVYEYHGRKVNIKPWNLFTSHTTCFGTVTRMETGELISRGVTHFRLRSLPGMLASLRLGRS